MKTTRKVLTCLSRFDWASAADLKAGGIRGTTITASLAIGVRDGLVERRDQSGAYPRYRLTDAGRRFLREAA